MPISQIAAGVSGVVANTRTLVLRLVRTRLPSTSAISVGMDAWRRRLRIIQYVNPPPQDVIPDLSETILREEGPRVLNWMLQGLHKTRQDGWKLCQSSRQQRIVDDLLLECESHVRFVRDCLQRSPSQQMTVDTCYEKFAEYCARRGWDTVTKAHFSGLVEDAIRREFGLPRRNDIAGPNGQAQRGWKGIGWK